MHHLGLLEVNLSGSSISSEYLLLGQIDIPLLSVNTDDHHGLLLADLHVLVDELNALLSDLSGQQVPFHVLILEKLGISTVLVHLGNLSLEHVNKQMNSAGGWFIPEEEATLTITMSFSSGKSFL